MSEYMEETYRLRARTPEQWVEALENVALEVRSVIAGLVWWDWFSLRTVTERWPHLDWCLTPLIGPTCQDNDRIRAGLMQVGYSPERAAIRVRGDE